MENATRKSIIEKKKAEKKKSAEGNKARRLRAGGIIALLFVFLYIPSFLHWMNKDNITSDMIRNGYIEHSVNTEGVIIRDEALLPAAGKSGEYIPVIAEGERVSAFSQAATISDSASASLIEELDQVKKKIIQAQNEKMKESNFYSDEIEKIDERIGLKVREVIKAGKSNSIASITAIKQDMDGLIGEKAAVAGENSNDTYINSLRQQRNSIQERINSGTSSITSQFSGIISYVIDGYESTLTPAGIKNLKAEGIREILSGKKVKASGDKVVEQGDIFVKVIKSYESFIVTLLNSEEAGLFAAGDNIKVRINDLDQEVKGEITWKSELQGDSCLVAIKIDRCAELLSDSRVINADLIIDSKQGLKVPLKALFNADKEKRTADILLIKANVSTVRQVVIVGSDEEYAIIRTPDDEVRKTVSLYDTYIINHENVKEGQIVDK
ncbi:MAG: hypothetical protein HGA22_12055 [Clostridiales bacterium]|nr:hypothetical protein [Clostridiales bacterium]